MVLHIQSLIQDFNDSRHCASDTIGSVFLSFNFLRWIQIKNKQNMEDNQ